VNRRSFLRHTGIGLAALGFGKFGGFLCAEAGTPSNAHSRPNILFMTADDMIYDSLGCTGCQLPEISPNLDRLAREGLLLDHCHIVTPICGPSRAAWITGTWPQHSGHMGHYNQPPKWFGKSPVTTSLPEILQSQGGYYTGVLCKNPWPEGWDYQGSHLNTGLGRDPSKFYRLTKEFIQKAADRKKPFFLHANSMDPHEYWAGQKHETKAWIDAMMRREKYDTYPNGKPYPEPQVTYSAGQVPVPSCWPDNPEIREEIFTYYNSVRRMDEIMGEILRALKESGQEDNTLVVFLSDHGIGKAFAKWSLYPNGTRTPLIVKWPGKIKPARHDGKNIVSSVALAPAFLEAAGLDIPEFMDAESILDLLLDLPGSKSDETVFTCFNYMNNYSEKDDQFSVYTRDLADKHDNYRPTRALHSVQYTYIWNGWADGKNEIPLEMSSGQAIRRILRATGHAERADFETFRAREEFYDTVHDPGCHVNLIADPGHAEKISGFRQELLDFLVKTNDHETDNFRADLLALAVK